MPSPRASYALDVIDNIRVEEDYSFHERLGDYLLRLTEPYWTGERLNTKAMLHDPVRRTNLFSAKVDIADLAHRERLIRYLNAFATEEDNWAPLIHSFLARVSFHIARTEAPVVLDEVTPRESERFADIKGFPILTDDVTILFADGGARKSLLSLWWAAQLSVDTPTLYLDWEMRAEDHKERLTSLFDDQVFPGLYYMTARAPLAVIEDSLREVIKRLGIEFMVVDSAAPAAATEGAEIPTEFFGALRRLRCGALVLAHMNRAGDVMKPFGSAFWHNYARATWYLEAVNPGHLMLTNRKNSFGGLETVGGADDLVLEYGIERIDADTVITKRHSTFVIKPARALHKTEPTEED
jgi:hypothetical protein